MVIWYLNFMYCLVLITMTSSTCACEEDFKEYRLSTPFVNMRCVCSLVCHRPQCECVGDSGHSQHYLLSPCHTPAFSNTLVMLRLSQPHKYIIGSVEGKMKSAASLFHRTGLLNPHDLWDIKKMMEMIHRLCSGHMEHSLPSEMEACSTAIVHIFNGN